MESLTTASEILAQLKQLTDGMASMRQDVDALKRASSLQRDASEEVVDNGDVNDTADESASLPSQPLANSSGSAAHNSTQLSLWAEEMELRDPLLDDDDEPAKGAAPIKVVPVTDRTNQLLTEAFTSKMTGAERRTLRASYTLPQNDLTRAPFLDAMMASECSKTVRSTDRSLYTLQGLILEAVGPLSQLLEAVNNPNLDVTMDQIGDAVETAITLIANASNKTSLMRRTKVLEEYNKELVTFASAGERDWTSAAPRLFGPNFLKEAADYLQHLQLIRKVKQPSQGFRQPPSQGQQGGGGGGGAEDLSRGDNLRTTARPTGGATLWGRGLHQKRND